MYGPPEGIGPAQGKYLYDEQVGKDAFVASIMHTAERGATTLDRADGWTIADAGDAARWSQIDPVSAYAVQSLGVQGGAFTADKSVEAGKTLKTALGGFGATTKSWAQQNGLITKAGIGGLGAVLTVARLPVRARDHLPQPFRGHPGRPDPGAVRGDGGRAALPRRQHQAHSRGPRAVVARRRIPPGAVHVLERGTLRLLGAQGGLHRVHPVGGRARGRRRVGLEVPRRDRRGAPVPGSTSARQGTPPAAGSPPRWPPTSPPPWTPRSPPTRRPSRPPRAVAAGEAAVAAEAEAVVAHGEPVPHNQADGFSSRPSC